MCYDLGCFFKNIYISVWFILFFYCIGDYKFFCCFLCFDCVYIDRIFIFLCYIVIFRNIIKNEVKRFVNVSYKIRFCELINVIKDCILGYVLVIKLYIYILVLLKFN